MKKCFFLLFALPLAALSTTTYTFSVPFGPPHIGVGFTYVSPNPIPGTSITLHTQDFAGCDVSAFNGTAICADATLGELTDPATGAPLAISVNARFQATGDPTSFTSESATFGGAAFNQDGVYQSSVGSLNQSTLTIQTTPTAAPEPGSVLLVLSGIPAVAWLARKKSKQA